MLTLKIHKKILVLIKFKHFAGFFIVPYKNFVKEAKNILGGYMHFKGQGVCQCAHCLEPSFTIIKEIVFLVYMARFPNLRSQSDEFLTND